MNFNRVKKNYDSQLWDITMVKLAATRGIITKDEFYIITNKRYEEA